MVFTSTFHCFIQFHILRLQMGFTTFKDIVEAPFKKLLNFDVCVV